MLFDSRLYYEITGSGEMPLLLMHGWGGSTQSWIPVARDLADRYRIINIDFPGFGKSPEPPEAWHVDEYCDLVVKLLESLDIRKCDIIAHSFGGRVALMLGAKHPELVGRQVLTGCAGLVNPESQNQNAQLSKLYDNSFTRRFLGEKGVDRLRNIVRSKFGSADYKNASPLMRDVLKNVVNQDLHWCLDGIKASTLLVWGENDTATPLWMGKEMEKCIRDAGLVVFENSGHFAYLEQYNRFITVVKQFLTGRA